MIDESNVPGYLLAAREQLSKEINRLSGKLSKYPKNAVGLTLNQTSEYRLIKSEMNQAFKQLQKVNTLIVKARKKKNPSNLKLQKFNVTTSTGKKFQIIAASKAQALRMIGKAVPGAIVNPNKKGDLYMWVNGRSYGPYRDLNQAEQNFKDSNIDSATITKGKDAKKAIHILKRIK